MVDDISKSLQPDIYNEVEGEKKRIVQWFNQAITCLENDDFCELLEHNLQRYSQLTYKENENIYNTLFKQTFPNVNAQQQFKISSDLPKLNLNMYLKNLECSSKTYCVASETVSNSESDQFQDLFANDQEDIDEDNLIDFVEDSEPQTAFNSKKQHDIFSAFDTARAELGIENGNEIQGRSVENISNVKSSYTNSNKNRQYDVKEAAFSAFKTAKEELGNQLGKKVGFGGGGNGTEEKELNKRNGAKKAVRKRFVQPFHSKSDSNEDDAKIEELSDINEKLKNIEPKMVELIMAEIMDQGPSITWDDIAGLDFAKTAIKEAVVWPMLRPDIFKGLRRPPKGILLFGPPGTGKTLIGKCVASQSKSTFFSISASSLTSKWIGDGEKMVRALFAVARVHQPAVIFIDEVDSLLTQRSEAEHESSRRIKTEFLVQLDGAGINAEEKLLIIGATNRPQELDEAARRRFVKRLYIPLPDYQGRLELLQKLISNEKHLLENEHFENIAKLCEGYSGADIKNLCSEASLEPIRSINFNDLETIEASEVRPLTLDDFNKSLNRVKPSVSSKDLVQYIQWDETYGSGGV